MFRNLRGRSIVCCNLRALRAAKFGLPLFPDLCDLLHARRRMVRVNISARTRTEGVADMREWSKGLPDWLATDMLVIAVALAIIVTGVWIAP
uniref:Uncharacterized protein n=1 Tax=Bradyrhizobium septentrionale TaxID=1404411 RepID=A0A973VY50_9BRAD